MVKQYSTDGIGHVLDQDRVKVAGGGHLVIVRDSAIVRIVWYLQGVND